MRIARITLPTNDNAGQALPFVHSMLRLDLCKAFGGCTVTDSHGAWIDSATGKLYDEPGKLYAVAAEWDSEKESELLLIAARYGAIAEQIAVMVEMADGRVVFIDPAKELAAYLKTERARKSA